MRPRTTATGPALLALPAAILVTTLGLARPTGKASRPAVSETRYLGSHFCASCHAGPQNPAFRDSLAHVKLDEFTVWKERDRHSRAYQDLEAERGRAIGLRLGVDVTKAEGGCLGCHSAATSSGGAPHPAGDLFSPSDGVSCETCHGPSEGWVAPHTQHDWRKRSAGEKSALGMIDLRDPIRQAALCASCHVGDGAGKVLTHAMFAAGHPPVPSVDASSADAMPRHWRLVGEKPGANDWGRFERSRLAITSAGSSLRASMSLLADEARSSSAHAPGGAWPDYARFDCTSCHHELVREPGRPSRRQERGFEGPPGRPPIARWSSQVVRLAIEELFHEDASHLLGSMRDHEKALTDATQSRPFGRIPDLANAAAGYARWADDVAGRFGRAALDDTRVRSLLLRLATEASDRDLDTDTARVAARAARAFRADLGPDSRNDHEIVEALRALDSELVFDSAGRPTGAIVADPSRVRDGFRRIADAIRRP